MTQHIEKDTTQDMVKLQEELQATDSRREAIKKIGKYSAFAAPVLLGMISQPARAS